MYYFGRKLTVSWSVPAILIVSMARSFVLWLHGLDDSGPANEHIKALFTSSEFRNTVWSFPSAPPIPVTCNSKLSWIFFWLESVNGFILMITVNYSYGYWLGIVIKGFETWVWIVWLVWCLWVSHFDNLIQSVSVRKFRVFWLV